jgi:hypothetical protein
LNFRLSLLQRSSSRFPAEPDLIRGTSVKSTLKGRTRLRKRQFGCDSRSLAVIYPVSIDPDGVPQNNPQSLNALKWSDVFVGFGRSSVSYRFAITSLPSPAY